MRMNIVSKFGRHEAPLLGVREVRDELDDVGADQVCTTDFHQATVGNDFHNHTRIAQTKRNSGINLEGAPMSSVKQL